MPVRCRHVPFPWTADTRLTHTNLNVLRLNMMEWIPVAGPWVTEKEIQYTTDAAANAWYANANVYPERFERTFAKYLGVAHAVSLPSCTAALHLALAALDIGPRD